MSNNCFQPCPPPCPPKCNCTSDDVPYVGPAIMCTGILTNQSLTEVINQLSISIKSRLFQIQSDSLVVTPLPSTCDKYSNIEVVPSEDVGNIFTLGSDGYPYVPSTGLSYPITCSDIAQMFSTETQQKNGVDQTIYDFLITGSAGCQHVSPPMGFAVTGNTRKSAFGSMEWFSTLTLANNSAVSGETVLIFNDTIESLTVKPNVNYQGVGFKSIGGVTAINVGVISLSNLKITDVVSCSGTGTIYCSNVLCIANVSISGDMFVNGLSVKNELATVTIFDSAFVSNFNTNCKVTVTGSASLDKATIVNVNALAPIFTPGILSVGSVLNGTVKLSNLKVRSVTSVAGYLISTNGTQNGRIVANNCDFEANLLTALYAHCGNSQDGTDNGSGTPTSYASNSIFLSHITARNIGTPNPVNTFGNPAINLAGAAAHAPTPPYNPNYIGGTTTNGLATHIAGFSVNGSGILAQGWGIKNSYGYSLNSSGISNDSEEFQNYKLELINCVAESSNYHGAELLRDVYIVGGTYITRSSDPTHSPIVIGEDVFPNNNYYITNITTITRNVTAYAIRGFNAVTAKIFNNNWVNEYISPGTPVPGVYHTGIGGNITMAAVPAADSFGNRG